MMSWQKVFIEQLRLFTYKQFINRVRDKETAIRWIKEQSYF